MTSVTERHGQSCINVGILKEGLIPYFLILTKTDGIFPTLE